jgi:hypothetical protein
LNSNKWVVDYGNSNIILHEEFDSEDEAIEWGKALNKTHLFKYNNDNIPLTYMHLVYEPSFIEDVVPAPDTAAQSEPEQEGEGGE